jgi:hypothetical protein
MLRGDEMRNLKTACVILLASVFLLLSACGYYYPAHSGSHALMLGDAPISNDFAPVYAQSGKTEYGCETVYWLFETPRHEYRVLYLQLETPEPEYETHYLHLETPQPDVFETFYFQLEFPQPYEYETFYFQLEFPQPCEYETVYFRLEFPQPCEFETVCEHFEVPLPDVFETVCLYFDVPSPCFVIPPQPPDDFDVVPRVISQTD